jgi:hypothetical protein
LRFDHISSSFFNSKGFHVLRRIASANWAFVLMCFDPMLILKNFHVLNCYCS